MPGRRRKYRILPADAAPAVPAEPHRGRPSEEVVRAIYGRSREEMIAEAAYYRATARGFRGGDHERDWLEAEAEIDAMLRGEA